MVVLIDIWGGGRLHRHLAGEEASFHHHYGTASRCEACGAAAECARENLIPGRLSAQMCAMGAKRVVWHVGFGTLLRRRGSHAFEVRDEVPLSEEPPRMDYLLLRKEPAPAEDESAQTLRRLWPLLPQVSVVEYKSPGRAYRTGNLDRLLAYVHTYYADERTRPAKHKDLCAVLVVPGRTPSLAEDLADMGLSWEDLGAGYWRVSGGVYTLYVVEIRRVAEAEGDDLLQSLGSGELETPAARRFWMELVGSKEAGMSVQDMEGYDELMDKLLDMMTPEQRLAGLPPEERLAGLDRDHQALALPIEVLRLLPEQYVASLSADVQVEIRRRLQSVGD